MIKELKNLFYILFVFLILFFTLKYYFSDNYKKKSYRAIQLIDKKIDIFSSKLILLNNDTMDIVEYVEKKNDDKKNYNFWKLINNNE
jgi:Zn-dependent protease with chaperone function